MRRLPLSLLAVAGLAACASSGTVASTAGAPEGAETIGSVGSDYVRIDPERHTYTAAVPGTADHVFDKLVEVYQGLGIRPDVADKARLIVGAANVQLRRQLAGTRLSTYLDCGSGMGGASAESYAISLTIATQVSPTDHGSRLATQVSASARPTDGTNTAPVACTSTGDLEARIAKETVAAVVAAAH